MCSVPQPRPVLQPVSVIGSWLKRPVAPCEILPRGFPGVLLVNARPYLCSFIGELPDQGEPTIRGFQLVKDDGSVYHVDLRTTWGWQCDCADATYRGNRPGASTSRRCGRPCRKGVRHDDGLLCPARRGGRGLVLASRGRPGRRPARGGGRGCAMTAADAERYDLFFRGQRLASCATLDECLDQAAAYLDVDLAIWCGVRVAAVRMADGATLRVYNGDRPPDPPPAA